MQRLTGEPYGPEDRVAQFTFELTADTNVSSTDLLSLLRLIDYMARVLIVEESQVLFETLELPDARSVDLLSHLNDVAKSVPAPLTVSNIERGSWHVVTQLDAASIVHFVQHAIGPVFASVWQNPMMQQRIAMFLAERAFQELRRRVQQVFARKRRIGTVRAESVNEEPSTAERPAVRVVLRRTEVLEVSAEDDATIRRILREYRGRSP